MALVIISMQTRKNAAARGVPTGRQSVAHWQFDRSGWFHSGFVLPPSVFPLRYLRSAIRLLTPGTAIAL
jgi:hypothetical protein